MKHHRLDHWLKLCCLYKHRSEATRACSSGHVKLNGQRAKPASAIEINDVVEITGARDRKLVVLGLPSGSISKETARTMYRDETPPPPRDETPWSAAARSQAPQREHGAGRPTKRERRTLEKWESSAS